MTKMIQVRHVPDEVHGRLKARAAMKGLSLSDYVRIELERLAERATVDEVLEAAEVEAAVAPTAFRRIWAEVTAERDGR